MHAAPDDVDKANNKNEEADDKECLEENSVDENIVKTIPDEVEAPVPVDVSSNDNENKNENENGKDVPEDSVLSIPITDDAEFPVLVPKESTAAANPTKHGKGNKKKKQQTSE